MHCIDLYRCQLIGELRPRFAVSARMCGALERMLRRDEIGNTIRFCSVYSHRCELTEALLVVWGLLGYSLFLFGHFDTDFSLRLGRVDPET